MPEDLRDEVKRASALGVQMYLQDAASWIGTDVLASHVPDIGASGVRGWITAREAGADMRPSDRWLVTFYNDEEPPKISFRIHVPESMKQAEATFEKVDPPQTPPKGMDTLIRARQTAMRALGQPRTPINTVILPAEAIGKKGVLVYLLAATTKPRMVVLGKHHRVVVSPDGSTVVEMTPLSKTDVVIPLDNPDAPPGAKAGGIFVTHIVTDAPLETHVFASLSHKRIPIYVVTSRGLFRVVGDRIEYMGEGK
jgi:hypothetical protein